MPATANIRDAQILTLDQIKYLLKRLSIHQ